MASSTVSLLFFVFTTTVITIMIVAAVAIQSKKLISLVRQQSTDEQTSEVLEKLSAMRTIVGEDQFKESLYDNLNEKIDAYDNEVSTERWAALNLPNQKHLDSKNVPLKVYEKQLREFCERNPVTMGAGSSTTSVWPTMANGVGPMTLGAIDQWYKEEEWDGTYERQHYEVAKVKLAVAMEMLQYSVESGDHTFDHEMCRNIDEVGRYVAGRQAQFSGRFRKWMYPKKIIEEALNTNGWFHDIVHKAHTNPEASRETITETALVLAFLFTKRELDTEYLPIVRRIGKSVSEGNVNDDSIKKQADVVNLWSRSLSEFATKNRQQVPPPQNLIQV